MKQSASVAAALILLWASPLTAQVPPLLNYQGHLAAGDTALTGGFKLVFSVYPAPTGGSPLWTETQTVAVTDGLFSVLLGGAVPIPQTLFAEAERYLGVKVENDPEMVPRQRIVSVGYAFRAGVADDVKGMVSPTSVSISGAGPVIDRQGRWVGGDVTARVVRADSVAVSGVGVVIDRQGRWVGPPQPERLTYVTVGPKGSTESPIAISANTWTDIEAFVTSVRITTPSVLDIRFDGMLVAGSNCMLRVRVDGNALAGNLSGVDDAQTGERRHPAVGISAIVPVGPGTHDVVLQGIVSSAGGQFLSGRLQSGLLTVRIYEQ